MLTRPHSELSSPWDTPGVGDEAAECAERYAWLVVNVLANATPILERIIATVRGGGGTNCLDAEVK